MLGHPLRGVSCQHELGQEYFACLELVAHHGQCGDHDVVDQCNGIRTRFQGLQSCFLGKVRIAIDQRIRQPSLDFLRNAHSLCS